MKCEKQIERLKRVSEDVNSPSDSAPAVVEEGLDIPKCNRMRTIEEILLSMCHDRVEPTEKSVARAVDTDVLHSVHTCDRYVGARFTMSSEASLSYPDIVLSFPGDPVLLVPSLFYAVEEIIGTNSYSCRLELPINCQLREDILCARYLTRKVSRRKKKEAESGGKKRKAGTKKRQRRYDKKVPDVFTGSLVQDGQPQFLTTITIRITKLTRPQELVVSKRLFPGHTCMFGMLTNKRLPPVSARLSFVCFLQ
ncbi:hypothetical protein OS493_024619 [Desmophyllum pertusum]|uniref:Uncharacterized protein n=1 Tax=Desmophyllum pertusum TaxID=174260 RepID=A0A9W9ZQ38_9CNID|nr:hypothetical protein OS493_024619 [Desmophyllum pertusum]